MSSHREPRAGSWRALVEQEQQQTRERAATRAAANAATESAGAAAEPVLGPWPFAGIDASFSPRVAPDLAVCADETTRRGAPG